MVRRRVILGGLGMVGLAGCVDLGTVIASETTLPPPSVSRGDPSHPTHGDEFPDFRVPDPHGTEEITRDAVLADGPFVLTFVFTSCEARCGELMGILGLIQHDAIAEGWDQDVTLLAMTWDPERDDAATLTQYAEETGVELDHEHFRFLRPEGEAAATDWVETTFGVPVHHASEHDDAHAVHYYMIFLVNASGIVERSYPGPILFEMAPNDVVGDVRAVVT